MTPRARELAAAVLDGSARGGDVEELARIVLGHEEHARSDDSERCECVREE